MNLVELRNDVSDVPRGLRALADQIERGDFGKTYELAWVLHCGNKIESGLLGKVADPLCVAHWLHAAAQKHLLEDW